jgi:methylmalonyl-CoA mutase
MANQLFNDFQNRTKEQWKQQAIKDLKGKSFEDTLLWNVDENIIIEPYYASEDNISTTTKTIQQAQSQRVSSYWQYREKVRFISEKETNELIINSLKSGADSLEIDLSEVLLSDIEFKKLLNNIKLSDTAFFFKVENNALELVNKLQNIAPYLWKGGIINDVFGRWMQTGEWDINYWKSTATLLGKVQTHPQFKVLVINSHHFHNAGANVSQELAYTLATAIETIDKLSQESVAIEQILAKIEFSVSVGTNYFVEIAKLRALKLLWAKLVSEGYGLDIAVANSTPIHCQTSVYYDAAITPHTNMLRATTEAMSAIIGGCDAISINAFDESFSTPDDFSRRIARNISIILKEESYLDKVIDPSAGSYFIENLTAQIAENTLKILEAIENKGGITEAFTQGFIQESIQSEREKQISELLNNQNIMVGVNKFRFDEKPFSKPESTTTLTSETIFEVLPNLHLSSIFEA